jgi:hypothetical protein
MRANWRARDGDKVTEDLRRRVLVRDQVCFIFRIDRGHICADRWGRLHSPYETWRLSLDHVKDQARMGKRAPSDEWHLVAVCYKGNIDVPSKEVRMAERTYLQSLRDAATLEEDPAASS